VEKRSDLCKHFLAGKCARGGECLYSHDPSQFPCRFHFSKGCERGALCPYSHAAVLTPEQRAWLRQDFEAAGLDPEIVPKGSEALPLDAEAARAVAAPAQVASLFSTDEDAPGAKEVELGDISTRKAQQAVPRGSARSKAWAAAALGEDAAGSSEGAEPRPGEDDPADDASHANST
jgi:hypothetical protein